MLVEERVVVWLDVFEDWKQCQWCITVCKQVVIEHCHLPFPGAGLRGEPVDLMDHPKDQALEDTRGVAGLWWEIQV